ncbi:MAG: hypothetical protein D6758_06080 [Gammaproteobacteria bacterium]|nr:MAG: hypothetical protein D6758_06080 [Gammaproteobacteria bacterium]
MWLVAARQVWRFGWLRQPVAQHLLLGCALGCAVLWRLSHDVQDVVAVHFLGVTAAWLMLGEALAVLAFGLAQSGMALLGLVSWDVVPFNLLLLSMALIPPALMRGWLAHQKWTNPLLFILFNGFLGSMLGLLLVAAIVLATGAGSGLLSSETLDILPQYAVLLAFGEGFVNGTLASALVVFFPRLLFSMRGLDEL